MILLMSISLIISAVAMMILVYQVTYQKRLAIKEATIREYERLQQEVFGDTKYDPQRLSNQYLDGGGSRDAMCYLSKIEHFCLGINQGIYSFELLKQLAGEYMVEQYTLWVPFVIAKRTRLKRDKMFCEFEKVAKRMNGVRYEKRA